jgi:hypothetical protein
MATYKKHVINTSLQTSMEDSVIGTHIYNVAEIVDTLCNLIIPKVTT